MSVERPLAVLAILVLAWMSEGVVAMGAGALLCLPYPPLVWLAGLEAPVRLPRPCQLLVSLAGLEGSAHLSLPCRPPVLLVLVGEPARLSRPSQPLVLLAEFEEPVPLYHPYRPQVLLVLGDFPLQAALLLQRRQHLPTVALHQPMVAVPYL